jgi:hypothetical protein
MVTILEFINGKEIIADVTQSSDGSITFMANPCVIDTQVNQDGRVSANLYPIALFSKENTVVLNEGAIAWTSEPTDGILDAYQKKFSQIITPPSKSILIG